MTTMDVDHADAPPTKWSRQATLMDEFTQYRAELDQHHDRRERIIKQSRDITAASKKMIFSTHRITNTDAKVVIKDVENKLKDLKAMFARLQADVTGENFWRYERSVSPGIQEYLEAIMFYHYVTRQQILDLDESQASLLPAPTPPVADSPDAASQPTSSFGPEPFVRITVSDYLGGISDVTGEMMRLAIASVGKNLTAKKDGADGQDALSIDNIGNMVREIKGEMDGLVPQLRWLEKKMGVMDASLSKIELASYNLRIRGAEYADAPPHMLASITGREVGGGPREVDV